MVAMKKKEIGSISCIKIYGIDQGLCPKDYAYVFDCHSGELAELSQLYDDCGEYYGLIGMDALGDKFVARYTTPNLQLVCPHLFS